MSSSVQRGPDRFKAWQLCQHISRVLLLAEYLQLIIVDHIYGAALFSGPLPHSCNGKLSGGLSLGGWVVMGIQPCGFGISRTGSHCTISNLCVDIPLKMKGLSASVGIDELGHRRRWRWVCIVLKISGLNTGSLLLNTCQTNPWVNWHVDL